MSDILHGGQSEADGLPMRSEIRIADINIRRLNGDAHFTAFIDVLDDIIGTAGD